MGGINKDFWPEYTPLILGGGFTRLYIHHSIPNPVRPEPCKKTITRLMYFSSATSLFVKSRIPELRNLMSRRYLAGIMPQVDILEGYHLLNNSQIVQMFSRAIMKDLY